MGNFIVNGTYSTGYGAGGKYYHIKLVNIRHLFTITNLLLVLKEPV